VSNVFNELVITGMLGRSRSSLSGEVVLDISITGETSIPDVSKYPVPYEGVYEVEPTFDKQVFATKDKKMLSDFNVLPIHTYETSNPYGTTFII
jgi:hypothetical protein